MGSYLEFYGLDDNGIPIFRKPLEETKCRHGGYHRVFHCAHGRFCAACTKACQLPEAFKGKGGSQVVLEEDDVFCVMGETEQRGVKKTTRNAKTISNGQI